ncbi:MAG: hypothetical protein JWN57_418 [Frankiales bacterium]|jgi:hypothetical protein|nr:hypothetical protein [Frankiales bacterium]
MSPLLFPASLASVTTDEGGSAGPLPLLIIVLLFLATIALIRNMSGRLRRLPPSFEEPPAPTPASTPTSTPAATPTPPAEP